MLPDNTDILGFTDKHQGLYTYVKGKRIHHRKRELSNKINFLCYQARLGSSCPPTVKPI